MPQTMFNHKNDSSEDNVTGQNNDLYRTKFGVISIAHKQNETLATFIFTVDNGVDEDQEKYIDKLIDMMEGYKDDCTDGLIQEEVYPGKPMAKSTRISNDSTNSTVTVEVIRNEEESSNQFFLQYLFQADIISQQQYDGLLKQFQQTDTKPRL